MANKVYTVGRDSSNSIVIDDYTDVVSRFHATIRVKGSKRFITDHSTNGTYLNGQRLSSGMEYPYTKNDTLTLGGAVNLPWNCIDSGISQSKTVVITISSVIGIILIALAVLFVCGVISFNGESSTTNPEFVQATDSLSTAGPLQVSDDNNSDAQPKSDVTQEEESQSVNKDKETKSEKKSQSKKSTKSKSKSGKSNSKQKGAKSGSDENEDEGFKDVTQVDTKVVPVL